MKLIVFDNGTAEIMADSALSLPGRPVFLPDLPEVNRWSGCLMLAVKVSRLGKDVSAKFAARYYDAFSVALRLVPLDASGKVMRGIASLIDYGMVSGEWIPVPDGRVEVSYDDTSVTVGSVREMADSVVCAVSRLGTLKIGDILLLPLVMDATDVTIGSRFSASLDGTMVLDVKIR